MEKQHSISDRALYEVVNFWWKEWTGWQTADTEQELNFLVPSWIKEIVQKLEEADKHGAKFDYEKGVWKNF